MTASSLKIVFAGTPLFASVVLETLLLSSHQVVAVYAQPDRPAGRGLKLSKGPVKELAHIHRLPVFQPSSLLGAEQEAQLAQFQADVMVVVAFGLLLPAAFLSATRLGCLNVHPSLLPRWRGAAPIQRALLAGDTITGVSIMQMDQGLDTGPVLTQRQYVVDAKETTQTLHDQLAQIGSKLLVETLDRLTKGPLRPLPQDDKLATYAAKVSKEEALMDWMQPARQLEREVRAFNPWPVSYTSWKGKPLRIWQAKAISQTHHAPPRTILSASREGLDIATGEGALRLLSLQLPGGKALSVSDFYNAKRHALIVGERLI